MNNSKRNKQCIYCAHWHKKSNYCTRYQYSIRTSGGHPCDKHNCLGFVEGTFVPRRKEKGERDEEASSKNP